MGVKIVEKHPASLISVKTTFKHPGLNLQRIMEILEVLRVSCFLHSRTILMNVCAKIACAGDICANLLLQPLPLPLPQLIKDTIRLELPTSINRHKGQPPPNFHNPLFSVENLPISISIPGKEEIRLKDQNLRIS